MLAFWKGNPSKKRAFILGTIQWGFNYFVAKRGERMGRILVLFFFVLLFSGMPIAYVLGISGATSIFLLSSIPLKVLPQMMWVSLDSFPLMALPFFILAGEIMNHSGITKNLIDMSKLIVGKYKGGLAYTGIVASTFFASISGSASATAAAIGGMLIPPMVKEGYDKDFTAATITAASVVGPIIPPSTSMVILAVTASLSVGGLFLSGYVPGILYSVALMLYVRYKANKENFPISPFAISKAERMHAMKNSLPALLMPIILLGGILGGIFTATEAAAMACVYGLIVGFLYTKTLTFRVLPELFVRTAVTTAAIDLILATSNILGWSMTVFQIPQQITAWFLSLSTNPYVILLLINILLLIMGCFMEIVVTIVMLSPILFPLVQSLGIHPLHFGIVMIFNLCLGMATPPLGLSLFVACKVADTTIERITLKLWPMIVIGILVLAIITYIPIIPMFLPRLFGLY